MAISTEVFKNQYAANGVNTIFAYTFKIFDENEIAVLLDDTVKTITTHYTVSGVGNDAGGNVTFVTAPTAGVVVTLKQDPDFTQEIEYVEGDDFPASSHEEGLDRSVIRDQALQEQIDRAVLLPASTTLSDVTLPDPEDGKVIGWTGTSGAMQNYDVDDLGGVPISSFGAVLIANSTADDARTDLGSTALGDSLFTVSNASQGRSLLELTETIDSWTPIFSSSGATFNHGSQIGRRRKRGKFTELFFRLSLLSVPSGTTSNQLFIAGLPDTMETVSNLFFAQSAGFWFGVSLSSGYSHLALQGGSGQNFITVKESGSNVSETTFTPAKLGSAAEIRGSFCYIASS